MPHRPCSWAGNVTSQGWEARSEAGADFSCGNTSRRVCKVAPDSCEHAQPCTQMLQELDVCLASVSLTFFTPACLSKSSVIASAVEVLYETRGRVRPPPGLVGSLIPEAGKALGKGLYPGLDEGASGGCEDVQRCSHGLIRVHIVGSGHLRKARSPGPLSQLRVPEVQRL